WSWHGKDGVDGVDGVDGKDGADLTVANMSYKTYGDYGLLFLDAVGEVEARIIYLPLDVQTPTSVTVLAYELGNFVVGETVSFDVVVNPTANAKEITNFYLVDKSSSYGTRGSVYGGEISALEVSYELTDTAASVYTISIKCVDEVTSALSYVYVAAEYEVSEYTAPSDIATNYSTYLNATAEDATFNTTNSYELISSTYLTTGTSSYVPLTSADFAEFSDIVMYEDSEKTFTILKSAIGNLTSVECVATGVSGNTQKLPTFEYDGNNVTVTSLDGHSSKSIFTVTVSATDLNGDVITAADAFTITVYPYNEVEEYSAEESISQWLPATTTASATIEGTEDYTQQFKSAFTYDFSGATYEVISFEDDYNIYSLGVEEVDLDAAADLISASYDPTTGIVTYTLAASTEDGVLLQPGTYTVVMKGKSTPSTMDESDFKDNQVLLTQEITILAPEFGISFADGVVVSPSTSGTALYMVSDWNNVDITTLIDYDATTTDGDAPVYAYNNTTDLDNIVADYGVRSMINGDKTTTAKFPTTYDASYVATATFYYELTTGVKFPVTVDEYSSLEIQFYSVYDLTTTWSIESAETVVYSYDSQIKGQSSVTVTPALAYSATQEQASSTTRELTNTTAANVMNIFGSSYGTKATISYTVNDVVYYSEYDTVVAEIPTNSALYGIENIVSIKNGQISLEIANNLNWTQASDDEAISQCVTVTVTDFFGNEAIDTVTIVIKK
ncbi:MAG: hypothetical protein SNG10_00525, partial [Rikenellaceae bacterium]